jgi:hypothetical protein
MFEGARRQAAETMDRVFGTVEIGRQMVVKKSDAVPKNQTPIPKSLMKSARFLVEMGGLEPPTPYMRSDSGAKDASTKKARKRRKASRQP